MKNKNCSGLFCVNCFSSWWFQPDINQNGNLPQVGMKIKKCLKPPPSFDIDIGIQLAGPKNPKLLKFSSKKTRIAAIFPWIVINGTNVVPGISWLTRVKTRRRCRTNERQLYLNPSTAVDFVLMKRTALRSRDILFQRFLI